MRWLFFSQSIYYFLKTLSVSPDILHLNDRQTASVATLIKNDSELKKIKTLFTIHNLGHKYDLPLKYLKLLNWDYKKIFKSDINNKKPAALIKNGIIYSDIINTVSPQYAKEILTKQYGEHLVPLLKKRNNDLFGVLNGLDTNLFNPSKDKYLEKNYSLSTIKRKSINKFSIQKKAGLETNKNIPLLGIVSRLSPQKGLDLIPKIADKLLKQNIQLIITGRGYQDLEISFRNLEKKYPQQVYFHNKLDIPFAQQIYGGVDMFIMPSLFEPCGLSQLIAMRYGTVPVVRATGGLKDTVKNNYNGFVFNKFDEIALLNTITKAIKLYYNKNKWHRIIANGMKADYSWNTSAQQYYQLYLKLIKK